MERLRKEGAALVYRCAKQRSEPTSDKWGTAFLLCRFTSSLSVASFAEVFRFKRH